MWQDDFQDFGDSYIMVKFEEKIYETEKAILFRIQGDEVWIPKSVIDDCIFCSKNNTNKLTKEKIKKSGTVKVEEWFAINNGLYYEEDCVSDRYV